MAHTISTTVYKAGFSTVEHLNNLVTKIITKYPVLATFKILKNSKKNISNFLSLCEELATKIFSKNWRCFFFCNFENFKSC